MRPVFLLASLLLSSLACSSGRHEAVLVLEPSERAIQPGDRVQLSLKSTEPLAGDPEWEIQEHHGGALLRSTGWATTYLAPQLAGTYHLVLTAHRPDGSRIRQVECLHIPAHLSIEPTTARLAPGAILAFTARFKGLSRGSVLWTSEPDGAITAAGLFTAPTRPGTYQVTATCTQDPSATATATVIVE